MLVKIPSIPGQEYSREMGTQTSDQADYTEVNTSMSEHLGSLVEACVFTQTQDPLSWVEDEERGLKSEISASFIAQSKALGTTTDIIVTCHPATLAAITSHSFVATPIAEITHPVATESILLKPCIESDNSAPEDRGIPAESLGNEQITSKNVEKSPPSSISYMDSSTETSLENVTVMGLKPFMTADSSKSLSSGQEMEPLVLDSYEEEHSNECDASSTNVMHIVVASTTVPPVGSPETPVLEQVKEKKEVAKSGDVFTAEVCDSIHKYTIKHNLIQFQFKRKIRTWTGI